MLDCKSLFEVLVKFNDLVFKEFKINIFSSLTLPSLAMKIYKALFMPIDTLYQINGPIDSDIRQSYTGGAVDVYIPHNKSFSSPTRRKLYYYDVNSLYPHSMKSFPMPTGKPIYVKGSLDNIKKHIDKECHKSEAIPFGFYFVEVIAPLDLDKPFLPTKIKTRHGIRTASPLGRWCG